MHPELFCAVAAAADKSGHTMSIFLKSQPSSGFD
jgi:hypothetical protein